MQLVLSNNRVIAHGENFLAMGGVVINTETGAKYENATVAECEGCPSDINEVGYEYHAGVFVPCAPYGKGNNNGYFMEVCETCATPRSSGIPILYGLKYKNLDVNDLRANGIGTVDVMLLWKNASPSSTFNAQTIQLTNSYTKDLEFVICQTTDATGIFDTGAMFNRLIYTDISSDRTNSPLVRERPVDVSSTSSGVKITFGDVKARSIVDGAIRNNENDYLVPIKIYGVKISE